jgi:glucosamine-6-phosphate deaminase
MKLIITKNYAEMSRKAAELLIKEIKTKPRITLGFATGSTPERLYAELVKAYKDKKVDFSKVTSFNLDEYYPIKRSDKNSYYRYMFDNLFGKVNINRENVNILNGETKNPEQECNNFEGKIKVNPIDVQVLGVGVNGHVGFDEPGSEIGSVTRLVNLTPETIKINSRFFKSEGAVPKQAMSMGIKSILGAKKLILLASGKNKANAINHLVKGKISSECPVTFLRNHRDFTIIVDKEASSMSI